jgi:hypothetical protein
MGDFTSNRDAESTKEIEQAIARIQARHQESGRATAETLETKVHRDTETQIDSEDSEDSERLRLNQKDLEGVPFGDYSPTLKSKVDLPPASRTPTGSFLLDPNLPLREFVARAAVVSMEAGSDDGENWKSFTWEFTRLCRSHPKLSCLTADEAFKKIPWGPTGFDEEEQMQFLIEWDRVRSIPGLSPLEFAAKLARQQPLASTRNLKTYDQFISLAGWLQASIGVDNPIFLPTRKVAEVLGLKSNRSVAIFCQLAMADGFMELVERATQHRATRYRFRVERYKILQNWKGN